MTVSLLCFPGSATAFCPTKVVEVEDKKFEVQVQICTNMDNEEQLDNCDGLALVFSITEKSSFTYLNTLSKQLREKFPSSPQNGVHEQSAEVIGDKSNSGLSIPVVLIGNKIDDAKLSRAVELDDAKALSQDLSCVGFFETAAICNADVPKAFGCLVTEVAARKQTNAPEVKPTKACCVII